MNPQFKSGTQLGPYTIVRLLGSGGMGEVYEAFEERVQRTVALKVLFEIPPQTHGRDQGSAMNRFLQEARTLAAMKHPSIVSFYAIESIEGRHILVMEYVEGLSLRTLFDRYVLSAQEAVPLFLQMLEGVEALHSNHILHRDLKPGNFILHGAAKIKILDFGIAKQLGAESDSTVTGIIVGTPQYIAPEVLAGGPASARSDLWALGAVFYECVSGTKLLVRSVEPSDSMVRFSKECLAWVPYELQRIIVKLCAFRQEERYGSAAQVREDLLRLKKMWSEPPRSPIAPLMRDISNLSEISKRISTYKLSDVLAKRCLALIVQKNERAISGRDDQTLEVGPLTQITLPLSSVEAAVSHARQMQLYPGREGHIRIEEKRGLSTGPLALAVILIAALGFAYRAYIPEVHRALVADSKHVAAPNVEPVSLAVVSEPLHKVDLSAAQLSAAEARLKALEESFRQLKESTAKNMNPSVQSAELEIAEREASHVQSEIEAFKARASEEEKDFSDHFETWLAEITARRAELKVQLQSRRDDLQQSRESRAPAAEKSSLTEKIDSILEELKRTSAELRDKQKEHHDKETALREANQTALQDLEHKDQVSQNNLRDLQLAAKLARTSKTEIETQAKAALAQASAAVEKQRETVRILRDSLKAKP